MKHYKAGLYLQLASPKVPLVVSESSLFLFSLSSFFTVSRELFLDFQIILLTHQVQAATEETITQTVRPPSTHADK